MSQQGPPVGINGPSQKSTPPQQIRVVQANLFPKTTHNGNSNTSNQPTTSTQGYYPPGNGFQPRIEPYIPNVNNLKLVGTVDLQNVTISDPARSSSIKVGPNGNTIHIPHLSVNRGQISMAQIKSTPMSILPSTPNQLQNVQYISSSSVRTSTIPINQLQKGPVKLISGWSNNPVVPLSNTQSTSESAKPTITGNEKIAEEENANQRSQMVAVEAGSDSSKSQLPNNTVEASTSESVGQHSNSTQKYQYGQAIKPGQTVVFVNGEQKSNYSLTNAATLTSIQNSVQFLADPLFYRNGPNTGPPLFGNSKQTTQRSTSRVLIQDITPSQQPTNSVHYVTVSDREGVQVVQMKESNAITNEHASTSAAVGDNISNSATSSGRSSIDTQKPQEIASAHSEPSIEIFHSREPSICSNKSEGEPTPRRISRLKKYSTQQQNDTKVKRRKSTNSAKRTITHDSVIPRTSEIGNMNLKLKAEFERLQREKKETMQKLEEKSKIDSQTSLSNNHEYITDMPIIEHDQPSASENTEDNVSYTASQLVIKKPDFRVARAFTCPSETKSPPSGIINDDGPPILEVSTEKLPCDFDQNYSAPKLEAEAYPEVEIIQKVNNCNESDELENHRKEGKKISKKPRNNEQINIIEPPSNIKELIANMKPVPIDVTDFVLESADRSIDLSLTNSRQVDDYSMVEISSSSNLLTEKIKHAEELLEIQESKNETNRKRYHDELDDVPRFDFSYFEPMLSCRTLVRNKDTGEYEIITSENKNQTTTKKRCLNKKPPDNKLTAPVKPVIARDRRRQQEDNTKRMLDNDKLEKDIGMRSENGYAPEKPEWTMDCEQQENAFIDNLLTDDKFGRSGYNIDYFKTLGDQSDKDIEMRSRNVYEQEKSQWVMDCEQRDNSMLTNDVDDRSGSGSDMDYFRSHGFNPENSELRREADLERLKAELDIQCEHQRNLYLEKYAEYKNNMKYFPPLENAIEEERGETLHLQQTSPAKFGSLQEINDQLSIDNSCEIEKIRISKKYASCLPDELPGGFPDKRLSLWSTDEAATWFVAVTGKEELREPFVEEEIDGNTLSISLHSDLIQIFNLRFGPAKKLEMSLAAMKEYDTFIGGM